MKELKKPPKYKNTTEFCDEMLKDMKFNISATGWSDWQLPDGRIRKGILKIELIYALQMAFDKEERTNLKNVREDFFEAYVWERVKKEKELAKKKEEEEKIEYNKKCEDNKKRIAELDNDPTYVKACINLDSLFNKYQKPSKSY